MKIYQNISISLERPDTDKQVSLNDQTNNSTECLPPLQRHQTSNNIQHLQHHGDGSQHYPGGQQAGAALAMWWVWEYIYKSRAAYGSGAMDQERGDDDVEDADDEEDGHGDVHNYRG